MIQNYFDIDEELSIKKFLKDFKEKKLSHYIVLKDKKHYINIRTLSLKYKNPNEKLKKYKSKIPISNAKTNFEKLKDLYCYGERLIKIKNEFFDFIDALNYLKEYKKDLMNEKIDLFSKREIFVLESQNPISEARRIMIDKKINLLPIVDNNLNLIGEVRPFDFLVSDFFDDFGKDDFYDENKRIKAFSLPVDNIMNGRPITIEKDATINELLEILITKKLPSIIITDEKKIYNIITYNDILSLIKNELITLKYNIDYNGGKELIPSDFEIIKILADRFMRRITKYSDYNLLKLSFKVIGDKDVENRRKYLVRANLSYGNHILSVEKETYNEKDEEKDFEKSRWDVVSLVHNLFDALEKKVKEEKNKK